MTQHHAPIHSKPALGVQSGKQNPIGKGDGAARRWITLAAILALSACSVGKYEVVPTAVTVGAYKGKGKIGAEIGLKFRWKEIK